MITDQQHLRATQNHLMAKNTIFELILVRHDWEEPGLLPLLLPGFARGSRQCGDVPRGLSRVPVPNVIPK